MNTLKERELPKSIFLKFLLALMAVVSLSILSIFFIITVKWFMKFLI